MSVNNMQELEWQHQLSGRPCRIVRHIIRVRRLIDTGKDFSLLQHLNISVGQQ